MSPIVEAKNLRKQYKTGAEVAAVKDVSFAIERGEVFSLLGPNGAGKTTMISMLSGLLRPTSGDAMSEGHSIVREPLRAKQRLGIVPDEVALYTMISARENLRFWGKMYGLQGARLRQRVEAVLEIAGLTDRADEKVDAYSGGMKRRLNIAVGLLHEPTVLFMDEPTVGIDPQSRRRILDTVKELNQQGLSVLYTTHYMEEAEEISQRIGIIDHGEMIAIGSQAELNQMVGEHDTIKLQLHSEKSNEESAKALAQIPGINRAYCENSHLVLQARHASSLLSKIATWANLDGASIKSLEVQEPNLETVFLHLTGRGLRD
jgi:linearmycin/streptolysin S transport system ATP-binding protein